MECIAAPYTLDIPNVFAPQRTHMGCAYSSFELLPGFLQRRRRASLLAAARRRIASDGYDGFTLRMVAADCNTTVQTVHNLIGSKREVLAHAIADHGRELAHLTCKSARPYHIFHLLEVMWRSVEMYPDYMQQASIAYIEGRICVQEGAPRVANRFIELCLADVRDCLRRSADFQELARALASMVSGSMHEWARGEVNVDLLHKNLLNRSELLLMGALRSAERDAFERWIEQQDQERALSTARSSLPSPTQR